MTEIALTRMGGYGYGSKKNWRLKCSVKCGGIPVPCGLQNTLLQSEPLFKRHAWMYLKKWALCTHFI